MGFLWPRANKHGYAGVQVVGLTGISLRPVAAYDIGAIEMRRNWIIGGLAVAASLRAAAADPLYTVRDLGLLPGATSAAATAINDAGVVVGSSVAADSSHIFRFDGTLQDLGQFPDSSITSAAAINSAGQIVGYASTGNNPPGPRAFVYDDGVMARLRGRRCGGRGFLCSIRESGWSHGDRRYDLGLPRHRVSDAGWRDPLPGGDQSR